MSSIDEGEIEAALGQILPLTLKVKQHMEELAENDVDELAYSDKALEFFELLKENFQAADIDDTSDQISNHSLTFEDMMKAVKEENCDEAV